MFLCIFALNKSAKKNRTMTNETTNLLQGTLNCIDFIKSELNKVKKKSNSNTVLESALIKAKNKAFERINDTSKPYVVYQVNKYFLENSINE
jgi:hypothetical protein